MIWGILTGLAATLFQDAGYIFSRRYVQRHGKSYRLLLLTQLYMGIAGIAIMSGLSIFLITGKPGLFRYVEQHSVRCLDNCFSSAQKNS